MRKNAEAATPQSPAKLTLGEKRDFKRAMVGALRSMDVAR